MLSKTHLNPAAAAGSPARRAPEWRQLARRAAAVAVAVLALSLGPQGPAQAQARRGSSSRRPAAARRPNTAQQLADMQQRIDSLEATIHAQQQHIERLEQLTNSQNEALNALNTYTHNELARVTQGLNDALKTVNETAQAAIQQLRDQTFRDLGALEQRQYQATRDLEQRLGERTETTRSRPEAGSGEGKR